MRQSADRIKRALFRATIFVSACVPGARAMAADGAWNVNNNGLWSSAANWSGGVPKNEGDSAVFGGVITANRIITVDKPFTVGSLTFNDDNRYTLVGSGFGGLFVENLTGDASVISQAGDHTILAPLTLLSAVNATVGGTFTLNIGSTIVGGSPVNKSGAGTLALSGDNSLWTGGMTINQGVVQLNYATPSPDNGAYKGSGLGPITIGPNGTLDLNLAARTGFFGGTLANPITFSGSGAGGAGAIRVGSSSDVVLSGALMLGGAAVLRSDATSSANIGFAIGDPASGAGSLGGSGALTLLGGGGSNSLAAFQLNIRSTHIGGTILDGARLTISPLGSLVGTGDVLVKSNAQLIVSAPAGSNSAVASVSNNSVNLAGGTLIVTSNQDLSSYLSANSTGGQLLLQDVQYNGGGGKLLDFSTLAAAPIRVGASGSAGSSIDPGVVIRPDIASGTLRFGGGAATLTVNGIIRDINASPTSVEQGAGGTTILAAANTYSGATLVHDGLLRITQATALGTATGESDSTTIFVGGEVNVGAGLTIANERFHLAGGKLSADPTATFTGAIVVDADSKITGGEQHGPISGVGALEVGLSGGTQILSGDNTFTGPLRVSGGKVEARSPTALGSTSAGTTVLSELYLTSTSAEPVTVPSGVLHLGATSTYTGYAVLSGGTVIVDTGHVFNGTLEIQTGNLAVPLTGNGTIRKTGASLSMLSGLTAAFNGPIQVQQGTLAFSGDTLGSTNGATFVSGQGVLQMTGGISPEPIFLDNANGIGQGAIVGKSDSGATISGPIELGSQGSSVGFAPASQGYLMLSGPVSGGSLTVKSIGANETLRLANNANTFSGVTRVEPFIQFSITSTGSLKTSSGITIGTSGALVLEPGAETDRIGDAIPISLQNGRISVQESTEQVGAVSVEPGISNLNVHSPTGVAPGTLIVASLSRKRGSIVNFTATNFFQDLTASLGNTGGGSGLIRINAAPLLNDGMVGGWAVLANNSFATYGATGIKQLLASSNNINSAMETDNVELTAASTLTSSKTINSLRLSNTAPLSMGSNTLTIDSGGIVSYFRQQSPQTLSISGGTLLPGASANGELFLMGSIDITSSIADAPGQPTTVVASDVNLHGNNIYSGGTFISGAVTIGAPTGLPAQGDVYVSNGRISFTTGSVTPIALGKVTMAGMTATPNSISASDGGLRINASSYDVQAGEIKVGLAGSGPMVKTGDGIFTLSGLNSQYSGDIDIKEGTLVSGSTSQVVDDALGRGLVHVRSGGTLLGIGSNVYNPVIQLEGGSAGSLIFNGELRVLNNSTIFSSTAAGLLTINPGATLLAQNGANFKVTGDLKANGTLASADGVSVQVTPAANRIVSGTGTIRSNVTIGSNAILAPGNPGGTLSIVGDLVVQNNGKVRVSMPGNAEPSSVSVTGNVDLSATSDRLELFGGHAGTTFTLLSYTGNLTGTFNSVSPWYSVNYDQADKLVAITILPIPGDANDDRLVNFHDFQIVESNFGKAGGRAQGDFDGNGLIDRADLAILFQGASSPLPTEVSAEFSTTVPEPVGLVLLTVLPLLARRRARKLQRGCDAN